MALPFPSILSVAVIGCVIGIDIMTIFLISGEIVRNLFFMVVLMTSTRFLLVGFGTVYWFFGHCSVYILYGVGISYILMQEVFTREEITIEQFSQSLKNLDSEQHKEAAELLIRNSLKIDRTNFKFKRSSLSLVEASKSPVIVFTILTILFIVDTIVVAVIRVNGAKLATYSISDGTQHQQYEVGVISIVTVFFFIILNYTYFFVGMYFRVEQQNQRALVASLRNKIKGLILFDYACFVGGGVGLYFVTSSWLVLGGLIFIPISVITASFFYLNWKQNSFQILDKSLYANILEFYVPPAALEANADWKAKVCRAFNVAKSCVIAFLKFFLNYGNPKHDNYIVWLTCLFFGSLLGFSLLVQFKFNWIGWIISGCILDVILTIFVLKGYFNTLHFSWTLVIISCFTILVHGAVITYMYVFIVGKSSPGYNGFIILCVGFGYPVLVFLASAFLKWKDDKWVLSPFIKWTIGLSQTPIIVFLSIAVPIFKIHYSIVIGMFICYLTFAYLIIVVCVWSWNRYWLPKRWLYSFVFVALAVAVAGIILGYMYIYVLDSWQ